MNELTDPDSFHYLRANTLATYRSIENILEPLEKLVWLDWFADALDEEIRYAADNQNQK